MTGEENEEALFAFEVETEDHSLGEVESTIDEGANGRAISSTFSEAAEELSEAIEELPKAMSQLGSLAAKMSDELPSPEEMQRVCDELGIGADALSRGDPVKVVNRDGGYAFGTIEGRRGKKAGDYQPPWMNTASDLADYWRQAGYEVGDEEVVFEVEIGDKLYDYPESKIRLDVTSISGIGAEKAKVLRQAGYEEKIDVMKASQSELAEISGIGNALAARIKADVGDLPEELQSDSGEEGGSESLETAQCPECGEGFDKSSPDAIEGDEGTLFCSLDCLQDYHT